MIPTSATSSTALQHHRSTTTEPGDDTEDVLDEFLANCDSFFAFEDDNNGMSGDVEPAVKRARLSQGQLDLVFSHPSPNLSIVGNSTLQSCGPFSIIGSLPTQPFFPFVLPVPKGPASYMSGTSVVPSPMLVTHGNYIAQNESISGGASGESDSDSDEGDDTQQIIHLPNQEHLLGAAENGELELVKKLLFENPSIDINYRDRGDQGTALLWACKSGQSDVAELLISEGANPNIANIYGWTPLIYSARYNQQKLLMLLLQNDADVDAITVDGRTAVIWAATNGDLDAVKLLHDFGANIDHVDNDGFTPLLYAIRRGHTSVAQYLMQKGANVWVTTPTSKTALHLASEQGNLVVLFNLINRGFDIDVEDADGWTPLLEAALWCRTNAVAFLLANGASPNAVEKLRNHRGANIAALRMNLGDMDNDIFIW